MSEDKVFETIKTISRFEGIPIQEAVLSYAARKKLPKSAFCGPDRTYPAQDAAHVRNAFARLSTFGHRLSPAVRQRIYACLKRKAKRFGVEHNPKTYKWGKGKKVQETKLVPTGISKKAEWYLKELGLIE